MKKKLEQKLDAEFERMGADVYVYHFLKGAYPFSAITIVSNEIREWQIIRRVLALVFKYANQKYSKTPATCLIETSRDEGIYGIAICDRRDVFNRQRGRIIAKGRLLKHLKEMRK